jgi:hypothetical protein
MDRTQAEKDVMIVVQQKQMSAPQQTSRRLEFCGIKIAEVEMMRVHIAHQSLL